MKIDIFEIEPSYRQQHLGRFFYTEIENYFKDKGFSAIQLFCSPRESEKFWRKLDFIQFPEVIFSESDLTFYKPLIKTLSPNNKGNFDSVLELWNKEPYQVKEKDMPNWTWGVNEKGDLENPILFPCSYNWNLRWRRNDEIIREDKVKYFGRKGTEIYFSGYLYIEALE